MYVILSYNLHKPFKPNTTLQELKANAHFVELYATERLTKHQRIPYLHRQLGLINTELWALLRLLQKSNVLAN
ncbi:MAG: hypothetical protein JWP57_2596 [Spirosoma sp.]|nr:hypothetical protein [Spirosoma sp.]